MSRRGGDQPELIELIPPDPVAFGGSGRTWSGMPQPASAAPDPVAPDPADSRFTLLVTLAVLVALLVAFSVGTALRPWERAPQALRFPVAPRQLGTTDGRLVFDSPPGDVQAASLGTGDAFPLAVDDPGGTGYLFAAPDGHFEFQGMPNAGAWAQFNAVTDPVDFTTSPDETVQGTPAEVVPDAFGMSITFGPIDGLTYIVITQHLSRDESLRFAEAVTIDDGAPAITDDRALGELRPVANLTEVGRASSVLYAATQAGTFSWRDVVYAQYDHPDGQATVASTPIDRDDVATLLRYYLPEGTAATVHGQPASVSKVPGASQHLVAWVEGGRLIVVSGPGDAQATVALAESVRTATADEWAEVEDVAARTPNPMSSVYDPPKGTTITLLDGIDPNGDPFTVNAEWKGTQLSACVVRHSIGSCALLDPVRDPALVPVSLDGLQTIVAMVPTEVVDAPEVRVIYRDATIPMAKYALGEWGSALPGPTIGLLVPSGVATVELWNGGQLVAEYVPTPPG